MDTTLRKTLRIGLLAAGLLSLGALTPAQADDGHDGRSGHEIRQDRREIRQDQRELANDRRDFLREKREGDRAGMRHERAEIRQDKQELRRDRAELRHDLKDRRHERRDQVQGRGHGRHEGGRDHDNNGRHLGWHKGVGNPHRG